MGLKNYPGLIMSRDGNDQVYRAKKTRELSLSRGQVYYYDQSSYSLLITTDSKKLKKKSYLQFLSFLKTEIF